MAEPAPIKAFDADGRKILISPEQTPQLTAQGGRLATPQEIAAGDAERAYQAQSLPAKALGIAQYAGPVPYLAARGAQALGADVKAPPELEAIHQGQVSGVSAGLGQGLAYQALKTVSPGAATKYRDELEQTRLAHEDLYRAGQVSGTVGSALIPMGGPLGVAGNVAEQGAAKALAGLGARGALGEAALTGGKLAARGLAEGALWGASAEGGEQLLGDQELAGLKILAAAGTGALWGGGGGLALGGLGSLAKSGTRAVLSGGENALARALAKTGEAGTEAVEGAAASGEGKAMRKMLDPERVQTGLRSSADEMAYAATGATRKVTDKLIDRLGPDGPQAVGNYINRKILGLVGEDAQGATLIGTMAKGKATDLLPRIEADGSRIGSAIGDVIKQHGDINVPLADIVGDAAKLNEQLIKSSATIDAGKALGRTVSNLVDAAVNNGFVNGETYLKAVATGDRAAIQASLGEVPLSFLYYERSALEKGIYEVGRLEGNPAKEAIAQWLRGVDTKLVAKLDEVANAAGAESGSGIRALKREYQLNQWAAKAADVGVKRFGGNNTFGIREAVGAAAGLATGHPLMALGTLVGGKILRERGSAAGAYLLTRAADSGTIVRALRSVDDQIGRASKGILLPASTGGSPYRGASVPVGDRALRVIQAVRQVQADPVRYAEKIQSQADELARTSPNAAASFQQGAIRAFQYVASKVPPDDNPNPLRGDTGPTLTYRQASSLVQAFEYAEHPLRFFEDMEGGKVTPDGIEAIKHIMPSAFEELQVRTLDEIGQAKAKGKAIPFESRIRLSMLLDISGDASLRPGLGKLLQENVTTPPVEDKSGGNGPGPVKNGPINLDTQSSKYDRLEQR